MRFITKTRWSPVEIDYLKANRDKISENQLSVALGKSRNAIKTKCAELDGKKVTKKMSKRSVIGKRVDLDGLFMRSNWEANTLRYLKMKKKTVKYEPKVFYFEGVKSGTMSYLPDFYVEEDDSWIEVKGMLDGRSKTQIRRFKKHYPEEFKKLKVVVGSANTKAAKFFEEMGVPILAYYNDLNKQYKDKIPGWE